MIKLIAFDWNGTLFSDTQTIVNADNKVLKEFAVKPITIKKFRETFHMPVIHYWKNIGLSDAFLKKNLDEMERLFTNHYEPLADKARTRSGVREVLKFLESNKIKSVIYSNHTTVNIEKQIHRLKINKYINKVLARALGDNSQIHTRTKEIKLLNFIKEHKFKPQEVVSVGDTEEEIEIGKQNGYHTVAITGGYNTTVRLTKHRPDFLIHNII
jgi:phosphoglycolate phosphatase-like HAD superfamily hydrolase